MPSYTFRDPDQAAARLGLLAKLWEPASPAELDEVAAALQGEHKPIAWTVRQIAYQRR